MLKYSYNVVLVWSIHYLHIYSFSSAKKRLIGKDRDSGKDWGHEEKGAIEDEMIAWHHWVSGHEFEQTPGDREVQGSLACCSPWGCKESETRTRTTVVFSGSFLIGMTEYLVEFQVLCSRSLLVTYNIHNYICT